MSKKIYINKDIDVADIDGDKVMMNMDLGKYFGLNSVGSHIWEIIKNPISSDKVVDELLKKYEVDKKLCKVQVERFIVILEKYNLITIK